MDFHLGEEAFGGDKEVRAIGEDRKEEGEGEAVTEMGGDSSTIGGEMSNCSKGRVRKGKPAGEVGGRGEVRDKPVTAQSELRGGVKELAIEGYRRGSAGSGEGPSAQGYASV